jgi:hypothetical protein
LHLGLVVAGYALQSTARTFIEERVVALAREQEAVLGELAGVPGQARERRRELCVYAAAVQGLLAWCAGVHDVSYETLSTELAKLRPHLETLKALKLAARPRQARLLRRRAAYRVS